MAARRPPAPTPALTAASTLALAPPTRQRSSATPLAAMMGALIVYASLYPFTGWRAPFVDPVGFLVLPWPRYWTWFDLVSNFFGYLPLGALLFGAGVRSGGRPLTVALVAFFSGALLSGSMETLQNWLPRRVPSNVDLALNVAGTAAGIALGAAVHARGWVDRWQKVRERWFVAESRGPLALLVLWPAGLLFPTPVPFGVGQVWDQVRTAVASAAEDTTYAAATADWLEPAVAGSGLTTVGETLAVALGILAPCLLAYSVSPPGWRRVLLVAGAVAVGAATSSLSIALNFGPDHAFGWWTNNVAFGVLGAVAASLLLAWLPCRAAAGVGLIAVTGLVCLVANAPADPYLAQSLQAWEQGRFIRFHGVAQWVGRIWPYAALAALLVQVARERPIAVTPRPPRAHR